MVTNHIWIMNHNTHFCIVPSLPPGPPLNYPSISSRKGTTYFLAFVFRFIKKMKKMKYILQQFYLIALGISSRLPSLKASLLA